MKKSLSMMLVLVMIFTCLGVYPMSVSAASTGKIVNVTATGEVNYAYHQIATVAIEYSEPVVAPGIGGYDVTDYAVAKLKELYDQRPFSKQPVTAVYTNSSPVRRADKTSVAGRYVIIELAGTTHGVLDNDIWKPNQNAGILTWRLPGEGCEWLRPDLTDYVITQTVDVKNVAGQVVVAAGKVPTIDIKKVTTPELAPFKSNMTIKAANGDHDIYFNLYLPKNYDPSPKYPLVFNSTGNGGRVSYKQQDAKGNLVNIGANMSRDRVGLELARYEPNCIIVSPQMIREYPDKWKVDSTQDGLQLIHYIMKQYAVDTERIYAVGSSFGTMLLSKMMTAEPGIFAAYTQCNGTWADPSLPEGGGSFVSVYSAEATKRYSNCTFADLEPILKSSHLAKGTYNAQKQLLAGVVKSKMPVWVWHGVNDQSISFMNGYTTYSLLREMYAEAGLSQKEIDKLVQLTVLEDTDFIKVGISEWHQASKMAIMNPNMFIWMFAQHK